MKQLSVIKGLKIEKLNKSRKIRLASFADGAFINRKAQFLKEARALNVFDEITVFNWNMLPAAFKTRHMSFMQLHPRGFGYWIWKLGFKEWRVGLYCRFGRMEAGAREIHFP